MSPASPDEIVVPGATATAAQEPRLVLTAPERANLA